MMLGVLPQLIDRLFTTRSQEDRALWLSARFPIALEVVEMEKKEAMRPTFISCVRTRFGLKTSPSHVRRGLFTHEAKNNRRYQVFSFYGPRSGLLWREQN